MGERERHEHERHEPKTFSDSRVHDRPAATAPTSAPRSTIKDVSRLAGVSVATVSKALNTPHVVSAATREKVLEAVRALDYRPNRAARGLVGKRTYLVGYRLPSVQAAGNPTLDAFLHSMVEAAARHGLEVVLSADQPGRDPLAVYEDMVRRGSVDGFILSETDYHDPRIAYLSEQGVPFVAFGRTSDDERFSWVDVDGAAGTAAVVHHLIERGHRRFGLIAWPEGSHTGDARVSGVVETLATAGLAPPRIVRTLNGLDQGRAALRELLDTDPAPTAIVAVQDTLAIGALLEARSRGLDVGGGLAITGFDDIPAAEMAAPPLTSVRQPFDRIGELLVDMLARQLSGRKEPESVLVPPTLVVRASSGGPR